MPTRRPARRVDVRREAFDRRVEGAVSRVEGIGSGCLPGRQIDAIAGGGDGLGWLIACPSAVIVAGVVGGGGQRDWCPGVGRIGGHCDVERLWPRGVQVRLASRLESVQQGWQVIWQEGILKIITTLEEICPDLERVSCQSQFAVSPIVGSP